MPRRLYAILLAFVISFLGAVGSVIAFACVCIVWAVTVHGEMPRVDPGSVSAAELSAPWGGSYQIEALSGYCHAVCESLIGPFGKTTLGFGSSISWVFPPIDPIRTLIPLWVFAIASVLVGSLVGSWLTRHKLRPSYWDALTSEERSGRTMLGAAWRDAGRLFAWMPLIGVPVALIRIALSSLEPIGSPYPTAFDLYLGAAMIAVLAACHTVAVNRALIRRVIGEDRVRCACDYALEIHQQCPECNAPWRSPPVQSWLFTRTQRRLTMSLTAIAAIAVGLAALSLIVNPNDVRGRAMFAIARVAYKPDGQLPLRTLATDALVVRFPDGCAVIVCAKPYTYHGKPNLFATPGMSGGYYRGEFGYASAFWPDRSEPGRLDEAQVATGSFAFDTIALATFKFPFSFALGPHTATLSLLGMATPEYHDFQFSTPATSAERLRTGMPAPQAAEELRSMIPPVSRDPPP